MSYKGRLTAITSDRSGLSHQAPKVHSTRGIQQPTPRQSSSALRLVWAKTNAGMGSLYLSQHELLPLFKKGTASHVNNVELGKRGRWHSTFGPILEPLRLAPTPVAVSRIIRPSSPLALLQDAILDVSNRGDVVIDPFLGSGSRL